MGATLVRLARAVRSGRARVTGDAFFSTTIDLQGHDTMNRKQIRDAIIANLRDNARRTAAPRNERDDKARKPRNVTFFMG